MFQPARKIAPLFYCIFLSACGGGSGNSSLTADSKASSGDSLAADNGQPAQPATNGQAGSSADHAGFVYDDTARFNGPTDIIVDAAGNVYLLDSDRKTIRKIADSGEVSTLPATGDRGLEIDTQGNLYTIKEDALWKLAIDGSAKQIVSVPQYAWWLTIGPSAGELYFLVTDDANQSAAILRVRLDVGDSALVYSGAPLFSSSRAIAKDTMGNLYVGTADGRVIRFPVSGPPVDFASGIGEIEDLAFDAENNLYVSLAVISRPSVGYCANTGLCDPVIKSTTIDKVRRDGTVTTFVPSPVDNSGATMADQFGIAHVALGLDGAAYVAYQKNHAVYKVAPSGAISLLAGKPGEAGSSD